MARDLIELINKKSSCRRNDVKRHLGMDSWVYTLRRSSNQYYGARRPMWEGNPPPLPPIIRTYSVCHVDILTVKFEICVVS